MTINANSKPKFNNEEIELILRNIYAIQGQIESLPGEKDQNFHIIDRHAEYLLKISNIHETNAEVTFQLSLLNHLARRAPGLPVPRIVAGLDGKLSSRVHHTSAGSYNVRLLTWMRGDALATAEKSPAILLELGRAMGEISKALTGFMHPGALRDYEWDLLRAGDSRRHLNRVPDAGDRGLLSRQLERFERHTLPILSGLRRSVIHNDANDWNVVVDGTGGISGVIDFGDALHTAVICEVAIASAYAALDQQDPLGAIAAVSAGFHQVFPLTEEEVDILFDLVVMRLVVSVALSASRREATAENAYLAISEQPAWKLLRRLDAMDRRVATAILRHGCGWPATSTAHRILDWLKENRKSLGAILNRPVASYVLGMTPLNNSSNPMTVASAGGEPHRADKIWSEHAQANGIDIGLGPWGEIRSVYSGDMFRSKLIDGVRRTCHLGFDLFLPAGTPVYTPLAATVRSVEIETSAFGYGCLVTLEHELEDGLIFCSLWGHLAHEAISRLKPGERLASGHKVGGLGAAEENGGWAPHLHLQLCTDPTLQSTEIIGVGEKEFLPVWAELFPDASLFAGVHPETYVQVGQSPCEIVERRKSLLLPNLSITYEKPIKFVRGDGVWLIDDRGRAFLDCFNNVSHIGHSHPAVVDALTRQAGILNTNTRYLHDNIIAYAERLTALLPDELCIAGFANSGSEANSLALRMMRARTGQEDVIVLDWAYHGTTQELIDLSPYKFRQKGGSGQKPHVHVAELPDAYRARGEWAAEDLGFRYAQSVLEQIDAIKAKGGRPGCFIAESMPSVAGQIVLPDGYLSEVYRHVREAGGICIADEVQVGFGRIGTHWWAFETQDVVPDIVTLGKPIGDGHPMAALVTTREMADAFDNGMEYFNTFGGNPVSCAVGLAVIDVIEQDNLLHNARTIGVDLKTRLEDFKSWCDQIGDVRGSGLFLGVELVRDRTSKIPDREFARRVCNRARDLGVLVGTEGPHANVLKLRPPMIFSRRDADHLLSVLEESLTFAMRST